MTQMYIQKYVSLNNVHNAFAIARIKLKAFTGIHFLFSEMTYR